MTEVKRTGAFCKETTDLVSWWRRRRTERGAAEWPRSSSRLAPALWPRWAQWSSAHSTSCFCLHSPSGKGQNILNSAMLIWVNQHNTRNWGVYQGCAVTLSNPASRAVGGGGNPPERQCSQFTPAGIFMAVRRSRLDRTADFAQSSHTHNSKWHVCVRKIHPWERNFLAARKRHPSVNTRGGKANDHTDSHVAFTA